MSPTRGLHHMTAVCGDPQTNVDFYTGVLGLHLVKVTVNFDDPTAYHFYYGDATGQPGTAITFFPYPDGRQGTVGAGQVVRTDLSVPKGSLERWAERLTGHDARFEAGALCFADPDGLPLALVETAPGEGDAILGMESVRLLEQELEPTAAMLTERLGFAYVGADGALHRFRSPHDGPFREVVVEHRPEARRGYGGQGTVHHIAFRADDETVQARLREDLIANGSHVSPVMDRTYFRSIYFREPGGVLFEVATMGPGFSVDEPAASLGTSLRLPPQYEAHRAEIESLIQPIRLPDGKSLP